MSTTTTPSEMLTNRYERAVIGRGNRLAGDNGFSLSGVAQRVPREVWPVIFAMVLIGAMLLTLSNRSGSDPLFSPDDTMLPGGSAQVSPPELPGLPAGSGAAQPAAAAVAQ